MLIKVSTSTCSETKILLTFLVQNLYVPSNLVKLKCPDKRHTEVCAQQYISSLISDISYKKYAYRLVSQFSSLCYIPYYLATTIPTKFNQSLVGKVKSGAYVIKYVNKRVVAFKVLSISNAQLKLSTPQGDVLVYNKID